MWVFVSQGYPYPFLNKMPQPEGFVLVSLVALTAIYGFYEAGALLAGGVCESGADLGVQSQEELRKNETFCRACCSCEVELKNEGPGGKDTGFEADADGKQCVCRKAFILSFFHSLIS